MRVSTFLPVGLAVVFRTQLAPCSELPPAPPDPTTYPTTYRNEDGPMGGDDLPPQAQDGFYVPPEWPPNWALFGRDWRRAGPDAVGKDGRHAFPYDTVFTEYDLYVDQAGKGDGAGPFTAVEPTVIEECKVQPSSETGAGLQEHPYVKVAARGCEFADGALALHPLTIELQVSDCKGSPLTAATFLSKPWTGREEDKKKLGVEIKQMTSRPYESGILDIIGAYSRPLDEGPHRGRFLKIANCPLSNDPELFPVLWRSICDFTLYDPRPEFDGIMHHGWNGGGVGECNGPFGGEQRPSLLLANLALSVEQLEAVLAVMPDTGSLTLSRVTLTGSPSAKLLAAFETKTTMGQRVEYAETAEYGLRIAWSKVEEDQHPFTADGFEQFRAAVGTLLPCDRYGYRANVREALDAVERRYVPWLSQRDERFRAANEPAQEPREEYTFEVLVLGSGSGSGSW